MSKSHGEEKKVLFLKHLTHRRPKVKSNNNNNGHFLQFLCKLKLGHFKVLHNPSSLFINKQSNYFIQEIFTEHLLCAKHSSTYIGFNDKERKISGLLELAFYWEFVYYMPPTQQEIFLPPRTTSPAVTLLIMTEATEFNIFKEQSVGFPNNACINIMFFQRKRSHSEQ